MNGRGNGNLSSRNVSNRSDRPIPYDVLFPRGSNMSPLSNSNYYANITQAGSPSASALSGSSQPSSRQQYVQRLRDAHASPTTLDSGGNKRLMPSGYNQVPLSEKMAQSPITDTAAVESTVGALSTARSAVLTSTGMAPVAAAAQAAQQIGQGIGSTLKANDEGKSNKDFAANSQIASVGNSQNAALIRNSQQDMINKNYNAAMIGSMFGPLGALAGHFVSSLVNSQDRPVFTANSFQGQVDPTDSGINRSLNTAASSGKSEMVDSINGN